LRLNRTFLLHWASGSGRRRLVGCELWADKHRKRATTISTRCPARRPVGCERRRHDWRTWGDVTREREGPWDLSVDEAYVW